MAFVGTCYLVEAEGRLRNVPPADQLSVDVADLRRRVHRSLVEGPAGFRGEFALANHPTIHFDWTGVGHTSAVVIWTREERLWAVTLLLNGLEGPAETDMIETAMRQRGLPPPAGLWEVIGGESRPITVVLHADIRSVGDTMLATVSPIMSAAFFSVFGTAD
jgi:hypothetical protein